MDPLSALSLSCNILDLIEKAVKCALLVKKLHDGTPMGIGEDAEIVYDTMQEVITALGDKSGRPLLKPRLQTSMDNILTHCEELCRALEKVLCKCKPARKSSWRAAGAAIMRIMISKSDIEGLVGKLKEQRTALGMLELEIIRDSTENINRQLDHVNLTENRILVQLDDVGTKVETSIRPLRKKVDEILSKMKESDEKVKHELITRSLEFGTMDERLNDIHDPAKDTFSWIFDHPKRLKKEKNLKTTLTDWFQHGSGVFHIVGKAGSGKSTLMKFIYEMPQTATLLQKWAQLDGRQLVICQFFFWRVTSVKEKMTLKGLFRGLLHNILSQVPELPPILFPDLWQRRLSACDGNISFRITDREVATAFETLMENDEIYDKVHIRLCFVIDGLDEFKEDITLQRETYNDLARKLRKWAYNPSHSHIKMCITSRPLPEFTSVFDSSQRMTLEKHTKRDIRKFVHDELEVNELFQELGHTSSSDDLNCDSILREVIGRADGVFLWVVLVVHLLKQELATGGSSRSLLNIVASSNPALNLFFEQIIHSIPYHHRLASFYLLAASMHLSGYFINPQDTLFPSRSFQVENRPKLLVGYNLNLWDSATVFELADKSTHNFLDFERHTKIPKIKMFAGDARYAFEQKRLASRCRGLLELNTANELVFIHRAIPEILQEYFRQERQIQVEDNKVSEMFAWIALARATRDPWTLMTDDSILSIFHHLRVLDLDGCVSIFRILRLIDDALIIPKRKCGPNQFAWMRRYNETITMPGDLDLPRAYVRENWFRKSWPDTITLCQQFGLYEYVCWGLKEFLHKPEYRKRARRLFTDTILNLSLDDSMLSFAHQKIVDAMVLTELNLGDPSEAENNESGKVMTGALWYEFIGLEVHLRETYHSWPTGFLSETGYGTESGNRLNWRGIEAYLRLGADADILLAQTDRAGSILGPQGNVLFDTSEYGYRERDYRDVWLSHVELPSSPISFRDFVAYQARHYDIHNSEVLLELIDRSISRSAAAKRSISRNVVPKHRIRRGFFIVLSYTIRIFFHVMLISAMGYRVGYWVDFLSRIFRAIVIILAVVLTLSVASDTFRGIGRAPIHFSILQ